MADKTFDEIRPDIADDPSVDEHVSEGSSLDGQRSEGPSGLGTTETSVGGADSVPATPDSPPFAPEDESSDQLGKGLHRRPSAT
ncbi:MAG TPA: hypothetical protein VF635_01215 [Propionibacteriaceae bacterium]